MVRLIRLAAGVLWLFVLSAGTVRAQGWGWEGWGGWTNTPEGALAQGMGHFYKGAGIFNERTAIADSINADTMMRWNDYISAANQEGAAGMSPDAGKTLPITGCRTIGSFPGFATIRRRATSKWATQSTRRSIN